MYGVRAGREGRRYIEEGWEHSSQEGLPLLLMTPCSQLTHFHALAMAFSIKASTTFFVKHQIVVLPMVQFCIIVMELINEVKVPVQEFRNQREEGA